MRRRGAPSNAPEKACLVSAPGLHDSSPVFTTGPLPTIETHSPIPLFRVLEEGLALVQGLCIALNFSQSCCGRKVSARDVGLREIGCASAFVAVPFSS